MRIGIRSQRPFITPILVAFYTAMTCYWLSRALLRLAAACGLYCLTIAAIVSWPMSGLLILVFGVGGALRKKAAHLTTLGSARWADESNLRAAAMIGCDAGLILGRVPRKRFGGFLAAVGLLFKRGVGAKDACKAVVMRGMRGRHEWVRLPHAIHTAVFSPSGGGKGVSIVLPFLLTCPDSCVVIDFKGENAKLTALHRAKAFRHRVITLDPFNVVTNSPDAFNPLDFIDKASPHAIDQCNDLAKALVVRTGEEKERHWDDSAEAWIAAVIALVVYYGDPGESRSLQTVRELLTDPQKLDMAVKAMCESDCWGGMLARMGGHLRHFVDRERASVLTTAGRHLRFLDTLPVVASTTTSTFDPAELRQGRMTIYLALPPEHMRAQSALLRVWIGSLLRAVVKGGLQETNKVHFILDEAASLERLEAVDDAVDKYRAFGVRLLFCFQSMGQLKRCFPEGQDQTLLSNTTQVFFGVNDNATADYVSARLGESTIVVDSGGTSSGSSYQSSGGAHGGNSRSGSYNSSHNWQQQARKLLKPEEVMALPASAAITFAPGVPPVRTTLVRYYQEPGLRRSPRWLARTAEACGTLVASAILCLAALSAAGAMTLAIVERSRPAVSTSGDWQALGEFDRR